MENKFTLALATKLGQAEIQESIKKLGELSVETSTINAQEAAYKLEIESLRKVNRDNMSALNKEIAKGIGIRNVECVKRPNLEKNTVEIVRMDTGKVVSTEPITAAAREEIQPSIPGLEAHQETTQDGQNHAEVPEALSQPD